MSGPLREWIEWTSQGIELLAVAVMLAFVVAGTLRWLSRSASGLERGYERYRVTLGKSLLLGLELLVAADIIRTVTLDPSLESIAMLGGLVVLRTVLSWTVTLEVEGRWPWQPRAPDAAAPDPPDRRGEARERDR
jgi:uncharacterized membrane protein